jgi:hypothetical protein
MTRSLLYELTSMSEDDSLICIFYLRLYSVNQSSKYDLTNESVGFQVIRSEKPTVLPLPVARDIPRRLWPLSRYDKTDWMHSS